MEPAHLLPPVEPVRVARPRWVNVARMVGGVMLLLAGVAMLVLPGPGIGALVGGLWLLGDDVAWARATRVRLIAFAERASARARSLR